MTTTFQTIGIYGKHRSENIADTLEALIKFLQTQSKTLVIIEENTAQILKKIQLPIVTYDELGQQCDLIIVVGGDGSMLKAARTVVEHDTPVLGINRGHLGFLTDVLPQDIETKIGNVLKGKYIEEKRFLLHASILHNDEPIYEGDALNDVVLLPGKFAHMISFEIDINGSRVCEQRADGTIVTTPTGSTAYALSGGGPILHPELDAFAIVPMFPHTLSSRPIVVASDSEIVIFITPDNETAPCISCDGQERVSINVGDRIRIKKKEQSLRLIHPDDYNYYEALRAKLGWES